MTEPLTIARINQLPAPTWRASLKDVVGVTEWIEKVDAARPYADRDARKVLDSVLSLLNSTERKLEALGQIELSRGDRARLEELQAVSALLRQQGKELQAYWDAGKEENANRYESLRQNAWATILKLIGSEK